MFGGLHERLRAKIEEPESQRRMVLVIVSTALLLDNMLYMVIIPIIPDYLEKIHAFDKVNRTAGTYLDTGSHDAKIGTLFACKAIVQLFFNPISGAVIDRVGYDVPMMIGLSIIFVSTSIFAFGNSFTVLMVARGLQGVGSAFADTSGFAMIADRFTEESQRSKALGVALAFVSFGCLVAPPFGGYIYTKCGKQFPFITLAFIALADGYLMFAVMRPVRLERMLLKAEGNLPQATPIWRLCMDPYVALCAGALAVCNFSLAFIEPTIATWMEKTMGATSEQVGLVWLPGFLPHVAGVYTTVKLVEKRAEWQWLIAVVGLAVTAVSCLFFPFCTNWAGLIIPICILCYGVALVDTAVLPLMGYIVDTRYVSIYGSVYAIADISYSFAYAVGPIIAGWLYGRFGFVALNMSVFVLTMGYVPILFLLRHLRVTPKGDQPPAELGQEEETKHLAAKGLMADETNANLYSGYEQEDGNFYGTQAQMPVQPTAAPMQDYGYGY